MFHAKQLLITGGLFIAIVGGVACANTTATSPQSSDGGASTGQVETTRQTGEQTIAPAGSQATTKLNLNTATREQFLTIPNVGDRFVREFMEYRPYTSILQFRRELGKYVSQDQVAQWENYLYVPIDPNQADAATLQQLPSMTAATAQQIIAARPYASTEAFLTKLSEYISADQVAAARAFVTTS